MADFMKLAQAVSESQNVDTDEAIQQLKLQKKSLTQALDAAIAQQEMKKAEQEAVRFDLKAQEKREKIKVDLLKNAVEKESREGPVAVGGNLLESFTPIRQEVAPEAADLPLLDVNSQSV